MAELSELVLPGIYQSSKTQYYPLNKKCTVPIGQAEGFAMFPLLPE